MNDPKGARPGLLAEVHDRATTVLSLAMVAIGLALIAQLQPLGVVLGLLFLAAGAGRLYVGARMRRRRRREG
jgi:4-hydroxybenzoate polyprenyltransferase